MTDWKALLKKVAKIIYEISRDPEKLRKLGLAIIFVPVAIYCAYLIIIALLAAVMG